MDQLRQEAAELRDELLLAKEREGSLEVGASQSAARPVRQQILKQCRAADAVVGTPQAQVKKLRNQAHVEDAAITAPHAAETNWPLQRRIQELQGKVLELQEENSRWL